MPSRKEEDRTYFEHPFFDKLIAFDMLKWPVVAVVVLIVAFIVSPWLANKQGGHTYKKRETARVERQVRKNKAPAPPSAKRISSTGISDSDAAAIGNELRRIVNEKIAALDERENAKCEWTMVLAKYLGKEDTEEFLEKKRKYEELEKLCKETVDEKTAIVKAYVDKHKKFFTSDERGELLIDELNKMGAEHYERMKKKYDESYERYLKLRKDALMKSIKEDSK